jgi:hypothetical protein
MFCHVDVLGSDSQWSNFKLFVSLKFMIYVALSSISQVYSVVWFSKAFVVASSS